MNVDGPCGGCARAPCAPGRQRGSRQVRPAQNVSLTYTWSFQRPPLSVSLSAAFSSRLKSKREGAPCAAAAVTRREAGRLRVALALHRRVTFRPLPLARRGGLAPRGACWSPSSPAAHGLGIRERAETLFTAPPVLERSDPVGSEFLPPWLQKPVKGTKSDGPGTPERKPAEPALPCGDPATGAGRRGSPTLV